jgi:phage antirepressor YoqD-like protein
MQTSLSLNVQKTMSSMEIAELTNTLHKDVLEKIRKTLAECEIDSAEFSADWWDASRRRQPMFKLPRRECDLVISGYSAKYRLAIIDRWQELEAKQQFNIPTTLSGALRLASEQAETIEAQILLIEQQKPAVEFVERYVESAGNKGFREVCKLLKANEARFKEFLIAEKIMYRLDGRLMAFGSHITAGRFEVNAGVADNNHSFTVAKFTPKGINWVVGLWAVNNLRGKINGL